MTLVSQNPAVTLVSLNPAVRKLRSGVFFRFPQKDVCVVPLWVISALSDGSTKLGDQFVECWASAFRGVHSWALYLIVFFAPELCIRNSSVRCYGAPHAPDDLPKSFVRIPLCFKAHFDNTGYWASCECAQEREFKNKQRKLGTLTQALNGTMVNRIAPSKHIAMRWTLNSN